VQPMTTRQLNRACHAAAEAAELARAYPDMLKESKSL
jgi:hypothetical protein